MKAPQSPHIPTPLKNWLDNVILGTETDSTTTRPYLEERKSDILNAILYPLKQTRVRAESNNRSTASKGI